MDGAGAARWDQPELEQSLQWLGQGWSKGSSMLGTELCRDPSPPQPCSQQSLSWHWCCLPCLNTVVGSPWVPSHPCAVPRAPQSPAWHPAVAPCCLLCSLSLLKPKLMWNIPQHQLGFPTHFSQSDHSVHSTQISSSQHLAAQHPTIMLPAPILQDTPTGDME